mmetsp:Transcript_41630/g.114817  ORF Transcript_41630/g.114817 Transcript_41630/m.114817 type:complete len:263 (+) Transcript_41630:1729-2517(+)
MSRLKRPSGAGFRPNRQGDNEDDSISRDKFIDSLIVERWRALLLPARGSPSDCLSEQNQLSNVGKSRPRASFGTKAHHNLATTSCSKSFSNVPITRTKSAHVMSGDLASPPPDLQKRWNTFSWDWRERITARRTRCMTFIASGGTDPTGPKPSPRLFLCTSDAESEFSGSVTIVWLSGAAVALENSSARQRGEAERPPRLEYRWASHDATRCISARRAAKWRAHTSAHAAAATGNARAVIAANISSWLKLSMRCPCDRFAFK